MLLGTSSSLSKLMRASTARVPLCFGVLLNHGHHETFVYAVYRLLAEVPPEQRYAFGHTLRAGGCDQPYERWLARGIGRVKVGVGREESLGRALSFRLLVLTINNLNNLVSCILDSVCEAVLSLNLDSRVERADDSGSGRVKTLLGGPVIVELPEVLGCFSIVYTNLYIDGGAVHDGVYGGYRDVCLFGASVLRAL